jgi:hypothetical protein
MKISVHDNFILGYEVRCETREIVLHTEFRDRPPLEKTDVVFRGVEAYIFEGDNFQNIILDIEEVPVDQILSKNAELFKLGRESGWPGAWNKSPDTLKSHLDKKALKGFLIYSSFGMTGWVIAAEMQIKPAL